MRAGGKILLDIVCARTTPACWDAAAALGSFDAIPLPTQVDPFDESSPIKKAAIKTFPPDLFFVLRVTQLLRGIAQGGCAWGTSVCM